MDKTHFPSPHRLPPEPPEWRCSPGLTAYDAAHEAMQARVAAIRRGTAGECVWLLEHEPVFTAGRSARGADLLNPGGVPVRETGRGGAWTWHGPGQRVTYLMLDVAARGQDVRRFVRQIEEWVILALRRLEVESGRRGGFPGVWVNSGSGLGGGRNTASIGGLGGGLGGGAGGSLGVMKGDGGGLGGGSPAKIAAVGVRLSKWVSWHGVAINLNPDLGAYEAIVPCGMSDGRVTSLHAEGRDDVSMADLDAALEASFEAVFGVG